MNSPAHAYHHCAIRRFFEFVVPPGKSVLLVGYDRDDDLDVLAPERAVCVITDDIPETACAYEQHRGYDLSKITGRFDYAIFKNALGSCPDIGLFLSRLGRLCHPATRVINSSYNYLWKPLLLAGEQLGMKRPGGVRSWLSDRDTDNAMRAAGFERVSSARWHLLPVHLMGVGSLINFLGKGAFFLDWLKLNSFQIFRPVPAAVPDQDESVTICLTCRNECDNIEPIVQAIPELTDDQEILFVEGHSTDGTREEIDRVIQAYPDRNIRVIGQPGKGQGDAIREGFSDARGSIIILLEADQTSPPENVAYFYDTVRRRHADFVEGSRFIYPLSLEAMPLANQLGNWTFAYFLSWLLGQHMTDVLSGIKAVRKDDFMDIARRWNQWGINDPFGDFELLFGAARLGLKTAEQPIHYRPRPYGESNTRVMQHGALLAKMAWSAFLRFRG